MEHDLVRVWRGCLLLLFYFIYVLSAVNISASDGLNRFALLSLI